MAIALRAYRLEDFERLYALDHQCFPPGIAYSKRMLKYFLEMPEARCIVAEEGETLAGFLITEEDESLGHILTLDVAEEYRRRGVGTQLMRRGETDLASNGITDIVLETSVENAAGIAFWKRHGFTTTGILPRYYLGKMDAYEMRKNIAPSSTV